MTMFWEIPHIATLDWQTRQVCKRRCGTRAGAEEGWRKKETLLLQVKR